MWYSISICDNAFLILFFLFLVQGGMRVLRVLLSPAKKHKYTRTTHVCVVAWYLRGICGRRVVHPLLDIIVFMCVFFSLFLDSKSNGEIYVFSAQFFGCWLTPSHVKSDTWACAIFFRVHFSFAFCVWVLAWCVGDLRWNDAKSKWGRILFSAREEWLLFGMGLREGETGFLK